MSRDPEPPGTGIDVDALAREVARRVLRDVSLADVSESLREDHPDVRDEDVGTQVRDRVRALADSLTPRTVTTVGELDALPPGAVVRGSGGIVAERRAQETWWSTGHFVVTSAALAREAPLTVLHPGDLS